MCSMYPILRENLPPILGIIYVSAFSYQSFFDHNIYVCEPVYVKMWSVEHMDRPIQSVNVGEIFMLSISFPWAIIHQTHWQWKFIACNKCTKYDEFCKIKYQQNSVSFLGPLKTPTSNKYCDKLRRPTPHLILILQKIGRNYLMRAFSHYLDICRTHGSGNFICQCGRNFLVVHLFSLSYNTSSPWQWTFIALQQMYQIRRIS